MVKSRKGIYSAYSHTEETRGTNHLHPIFGSVTRAPGKVLGQGYKLNNLGQTLVWLTIISDLVL
jgi:hypothetical protein